MMETNELRNSGKAVTAGEVSIFQKQGIFLNHFLERGEGREKERDGNIDAREKSIGLVTSPT